MNTSSLINKESIQPIYFIRAKGEHRAPTCSGGQQGKKRGSKTCERERKGIHEDKFLLVTNMDDKEFMPQLHDHVNYFSFVK